MSLQYNDICRFIMQPSLQKTSEVDPRDLQETMQTYRVNEPQATAILKAMKTNGFALIQGYVC
jgi:senataxin